MQQISEEKRSIYFYNFNNSLRTEINFQNDLYPYYMAVSPDGKYLAISCAPANGLDSPWELYVVEIENGATRQITNEGFLASGISWVKFD